MSEKNIELTDDDLQPLFNYFDQEHYLQLLPTELREIVWLAEYILKHAEEQPAAEPVQDLQR